MNCLLCARPGCELEELTFTPAISQVGPRGVLGPNPHCCCSLQFSSWGQILGDPQELFFSQGACGQRRAAEPWAKRPHRSELEGEHLRGRSPLLLGTSLLLPAPVALIPSAPTSHPPDTQAGSVFPGPGAGGELRSSFGDRPRDGGGKAELYRGTPDWKAGDSAEAENQGEGPAETERAVGRKNKCAILDEGEPAV